MESLDGLNNEVIGSGNLIVGTDNVVLSSQCGECLPPLPLPPPPIPTKPVATCLNCQYSQTCVPQAGCPCWFTTNFYFNYASYWILIIIFNSKSIKIWKFYIPIFLSFNLWILPTALLKIKRLIRFNLYKQI